MWLGPGALVACPPHSAVGWLTAGGWWIVQSAWRHYPGGCEIHGCRFPLMSFRRALRSKNLQRILALLRTRELVRRIGSDEADRDEM